MFFRRNQHPTQEDLSAYIDEQLDAAAMGRVAAHIDACDECLDAVESLRMTATMLAELPRAIPPRAFTLTPEMAGIPIARPSPPRRSIFTFAPALSLAVLAILLVVDVSMPAQRSSDETASMSADSALTAKSSAESANSAAGTTLPNAPASESGGVALQQAPRAAANNDASVPGSAGPIAGAGAIPPAAAPTIVARSAPASATPVAQPQAAAAAGSPSQPSIFSAPQAASGSPAPQPSIMSAPAGGAAPTTPSAGGPTTQPVPSAGGATSPAPPPLVPPAVIPGFSPSPQAAEAARAVVPPAPTLPSAGAAIGGATPATGGAGGAVTSPGLAPQPNVTELMPYEPDNPSVTVAARDASDGGSRTLLRVLEALAAAAFVTTLFAFVIWPRISGKERS